MSRLADDARSVRRSAPIQRTIWYVSENGSDITGDGSAKHPFRTIERALKECQSYDTIQLACGEYWWGSLPEWIDDITVRGEQVGGSCTILTGNIYIDQCSFTLQNCDFRGDIGADHADLTILDCDFSHGGGNIQSGCDDMNPSYLYVAGCNLSGGGSIDHFTGGYLTLVDCVLGGHAVAVRGNSMDVWDCQFSNNGTAIAYTGSDYWPSNISIADCTFWNNGTAIRLDMHGIEDIGGGDEASISGCLFYDNSGTILAGEVALPGMVNVSGCTMAFNQAAVIDMYSYDGDPVDISNSLIAFNGGAAVTTAAQLSCCDICGNVGGDWTPQIAGQLGLNGNIAADPLFCAVAADDYHLQYDSPCLHTPGCGRIGALAGGCESTSIGVSSMSAIKALY